MRDGRSDSGVNPVHLARRSTSCCTTGKPHDRGTSPRALAGARGCTPSSDVSGLLGDSESNARGEVCHLLIAEIEADICVECGQLLLIETDNAASAFSLLTARPTVSRFALAPRPIRRGRSAPRQIAAISRARRRYVPKTPLAGAPLQPSVAVRLRLGMRPLRSGGVGPEPPRRSSNATTEAAIPSRGRPEAPPRGCQRMRGRTGRRCRCPAPRSSCRPQAPVSGRTNTEQTTPSQAQRPPSASGLP